MFRRIVSTSIKKIPLSGRARSTRAIKQVTDTRPTLLDPWEPLSRDFEALESRLSPRNMLRGLLTPLETTFDPTPPMDIKETPSAYQIHMDLPGVKKTDIAVDVQDSVLHIVADRAHVSKSEGEMMRVFERFRGHVSRQIRLPDDINQDCIEASYEDGVLNLTVPKKEVDSKVHALKKIDIK